MLELLNGVHLPLPAVPGGHLVLAPPPDVVTHLDLIGAQSRPGQHLIECVHRRVNNVIHLQHVKLGGKLILKGVRFLGTPPQKVKINPKHEIFFK